ncbi:restriction endonuclease subunit S [soil metagenome]
MTRFGTAVRRIDERQPGVDLPLLSVSQTRGVLRQSELFDRPPRADSLDTYKVCRRDDIVFNKMSIRSGAMGIAVEDGLVTYHYEVMRPVKGAVPRYLVYLMKSSTFTGELIKNERGIGAGGTAGVRTTEVPFSVLRNIDAYIPRPLEQRQIAEYLDAQTAKIDALIGKQERLIETLAERRQAVISRAVTKGLNPNARWSATGVGWLGDVPETWRVKPLWSMFERVKDIGHPDEIMLSVFRDLGVVVKDEHANLNQTAENRNIYQLVESGWLVTNRMKAWQGSVGISGFRGIVSGHYICFRPRHAESPRYLNYLFRSTQYAAGYATLSRGVRTGQAEIDNDQYRQLPVLVPARSEQDAIVEYLDRETSQIDALSAKAREMIDVLKERRQALISAAVTGKIDVRGLS